MRLHLIITIFVVNVSCTWQDSQSLDINHAEQLCILNELFTIGILMNSSLNNSLDMQLFKRRRAEQLEAVKGFKKFNSYEKQFSMILVLARKIFSVIESSRVLLEASDYIPGNSPFPRDETIRDALSNILENTALFGEIVLRFPEISHTVLKTNYDWSILYQWSIGFCNLTNNLLDKSTITLIHLVSQELHYVERDPNYRNPYRKNASEAAPNSVPLHAKKKKKKELKKGPRMSVGQRAEL